MVSFLFMLSINKTQLFLETWYVLWLSRWRKGGRAAQTTKRRMKESFRPEGSSAGLYSNPSTSASLGQTRRGRRVMPRRWRVNSFFSCTLRHINLHNCNLHAGHWFHTRETVVKLFSSCDWRRKCF